MEIKRAKDLDENIREKISELFVEAFGQELKIISRDADKLIKAFSHIFVLDYFYIGIIDNEIAGMMACTDKEHYCIHHNKKILLKNLGFVKGFLATMIFTKYFNKYPKYPVEIDEKTGSIEFVATNKKQRRTGAASLIMEYIFSLNMYEKYILEVADTNEKAFNLYKKMGYKEVHRIKQKYAKKMGINYLVYMVK
ncbi:MAG: GNAT family N-acetyltransferase [Spirochaetaceae bacterium]|jgi:ribosomal protein S18 acetylase RimI-like enzyme|nr:GNAT family N-acetyltransferase [Spirochaetaceae bacterium]